MNPEKIRGYAQEERDLRQRISDDKKSYKTESPSAEMTSAERFSALCDRFEALPGVEASGCDNAKVVEVVIPDTKEDARDALRLQLEIGYGLFRRGQTEVGGEVINLIATWRDYRAGGQPILEQYVFADRDDPAGLSILEDSLTAAEQVLLPAAA